MPAFTRHIIGLFFIGLLLIKGSDTLLSLTSPGKDLPVTEAMAEQEQENKNNNKAKGEAADELFETTLPPANGLIVFFTPVEHTQHCYTSLPDICLDTLTPPPNG
ncbi:MAG: hypothetical protein ABW019_16365 [Chitinophagaceae bacterium]